MSPADIEALGALYSDSRQQLYTYALSITGNRETAEDTIHGVFEKLLRAPGLPEDLRPYVFRSIRNAALDSWRRTKVRSDSIFDPAAAAMQHAEPGDSIACRAKDLEQLLQRLSPDEREAIVLKLYGGFTFREIAALRDVPLPTVASWYRRAVGRLKIMLITES